MTATPLLPMVSLAPPNWQWFSSHGCVVHGELEHEVWVGGSLVGVYATGDKVRRNTILIGLMEGGRVNRGRLARAFNVSEATLRRVERRYAAEGVAGLLPRYVAGPGRPRKVNAGLRRRLWALFDRGGSVADAVAKYGTKEDISEVTLRRERAQWKKKRARKVVSSPDASTSTVAPRPPSDKGHDEPEPKPEERSDEIASSPVVSGGTVQHLGTWLMMAMLHEMGLYTSAMEAAGRRVRSASLRVVMDAVVAALSIGQQCVEGVLRLATPSASVLLRTGHAPSASWARRVLGKLAMETGGARLQLAMAGRYLREASAAADGSVRFSVYETRLGHQ